MVLRVVVTDPDDAEDQTFEATLVGELPLKAAAVLTAPEIGPGNVVTLGTIAWDELTLAASETATGTETESETETGTSTETETEEEKLRSPTRPRSSFQGVKAVGYWTVTQSWAYPSAPSAVGVSGASPR